MKVKWKTLWTFLWTYLMNILFLITFVVSNAWFLIEVVMFYTIYIYARDFQCWCNLTQNCCLMYLYYYQKMNGKHIYLVTMNFNTWRTARYTFNNRQKSFCSIANFGGGHIKWGRWECEWGQTKSVVWDKYLRKRWFL